MDTIAHRASELGDRGVAREERRFFIINAGRTGSTLLSAVLADAGADFCMSVPDSWNRAQGDLEHPDLREAVRCLQAAEEISPARRPAGLNRFRWTMLRSRGKRRLKVTLERASFAKVDEAHLLVRLAFKMGFFPSVILNYRRFEDHAVSLGLIHSHASLESLLRHYERLYRNGLWLLYTFGGCVVGYDQLTDRDECGWALPLALVTGLPAPTLVAARDRRLERPSPRVESMWLEDSVTRTFETIEALRGHVIPPSAQALRAWRGRVSAG